MIAPSAQSAVEACPMSVMHSQDLYCHRCLIKHNLSLKKLKNFSLMHNQNMHTPNVIYAFYAPLFNGNLPYVTFLISYYKTKI